MPAFTMTSPAALRQQMDVLQEAYAKLPQALSRKHVLAAMKRAVKDMNLENDFRRAAEAHEVTGNLRKSVTIVSGIARQGAAQGRAFARIGYGRSKRKLGHHALMLHEGTKNRFLKTPPHRYVGKGPRTAFASSAMDRARTQALYTVADRLLEALGKAVNELPRYLQFKKR